MKWIRQLLCGHKRTNHERFGEATVAVYGRWGVVYRYHAEYRRCQDCDAVKPSVTLASASDTLSQRMRAYGAVPSYTVPPKADGTPLE
jgi:hypothetical protein